MVYFFHETHDKFDIV